MRLLKANCLNCHNEEKEKGGLVLTSRERALKGGDNGPILTPGKADESQLAKLVHAEADPHMPPKKQLSAEQIQTLRAWIDAGADWDEAILGEAAPAIKPVTLGPLPPAYQPALAVALSPDGKRLAASRGAHIYIHDLGEKDFPIVHQLEQHRDAVQSIAWSQDGRWLASGGFREICLWNAESFEAAKTFTNIAGRVTALGFQSDNAILVAGESVPGGDGSVSFWSVESGDLQDKWPAHADSVLSVCVASGRELLATAGADKLVRLWQGPTEKAKFEGHLAHVLALAFNHDQTWLASGSADRVLNIWDVETGEQKIKLRKGLPGVTALAWVAEGKTLYGAFEDGTVRRFTDFKTHSGMERSEGAKARVIGNAEQMLYSLAATADGKTVYAGAHDGGVYAWSGDGKLLGKLAAQARSEAKQDSAQAESPPEAASSTASSNRRLSFVNDVLPVLSKAGCNAGACHAKPDGQNGFKLSVFAYDPQSDYNEIVKDSRGRRVFPAAAEESLILRKPTLAIDHEGGERFPRGSKPYQLLVEWVRQGMPYRQPNEPELVEIAAHPPEQRYEKGARQQLKVEARYSDGSARDVTHLAEFDSNDKEMARVDHNGRVSVGSLSGEGVIIARFMGHVDVSRITVPAEKVLPESIYAALPVNNFIDEHAYARFRKLGLFPSDRCTDGEFIRRASLDAIGRLPDAERVRGFLPETDSGKRRKLIDELLAHPAYAEHWATKWGDWIRPNPARVGVKSVYVLDQWLRESFRRDKPYDRFVREIITAQGSTHQVGPTVLFRDRRQPEDVTTVVSQIFLGTRLECAKCHHHPNEKWSQADFYQFAAYFGELKRKGTGISPPISGGWEMVYHAPGGEVKHPVTGEVMKPRALGSANDGGARESRDPREELAEWMTEPDNPFLARAVVNRVWAQYFGRGIVDPVDDFRASNPPTNEPLLDALARDFVAHGYDLKHLMRTIMSSHLYQLSAVPNEYNLTDTRNFSRAYRRRLPAEVMLDAVSDVTGASQAFYGLAAGSRAIETWNHKLESEFMDAFGRPDSSADCPCERNDRPSLVQALHLMNSSSLQNKIAHKDGRAKQWAEGSQTPEEIVRELYLIAYSRLPSEEELGVATEVFKAPDARRQAAIEDVMWALLNSAEFVFNH